MIVVTTLEVNLVLTALVMSRLPIWAINNIYENYWQNRNPKQRE